MSRGPGHIERTILKLIERHPSLDAFEIAAKAHDIWRLDKDITRGQYVSALRAMRAIATKFPKRFALAGGKGSARLVLCTRRYYDYLHEDPPK
jgi:hypothetical protein